MTIQSDCPIDYIERQTGIAPTAAVIWLHGLGADGHDFEPLVPQLQLPAAPAVRFVFPHAPVQPVTVNGGMRMRSWYDIATLSFDREHEHDRAGLEQSAGLVNHLIAQEMQRGIAARRIVLAGFSQGGAVALYTALRHVQPLAGVVVLSAYLPFAAETETERSAANLELPIFVAHGAQDAVIPVALAERSVAVLRGLQYAVQWQSYPIEHGVDAREIAAVADFIRRQLA